MLPPAYLTPFVPSGTPATVSFQSISSVAAMPTVDGSNTDTVITNSSGLTVWLTFSAVVAGSTNQRGEVALQPGQTVLVTATQATANAANSPIVIYNINAATASTVSIIGSSGGSAVTIQRGTATPRLTF